MLFINISSDKVQVADAQQEKFLDRNSIESTLGPTLVDRYKITPFQEILLLNGPGGFTNLRVGSLTLNLIAKLLNYKLQIADSLKLYTITKLDLFSSLFKKKFLPPQGAIYIGQRENIRIYDAVKKTYEQTKLSTLKKDLGPGKGKSWFFDYVKDDYRGNNTSNMISFHMTKKGWEIHWKKKKILVTIKDLGLIPQSQVKPEYMIEAIIS